MTSRHRPPEASSQECIGAHHMLIAAVNEYTGEILGSWCIWCGCGVYDQERITPAGRLYGDALELIRLRFEAMKAPWYGRCSSSDAT